MFEKALHGPREEVYSMNQSEAPFFVTGLVYEQLL